MTNIFTALKSVKMLLDDDSKQHTVNLFGDYQISVQPRPDSGSLGCKSDAIISVKCLRFANFMATLSSDYRSHMVAYKSRKLRNDFSGTLAFALVAATLSNSEVILRSGVDLRVAEFAEIAAAVDNPLALRELLFVGRWSKFVASVETVWAYLFLSFDSGLSQVEVLEQLIGSPDLVSRWRLKAPVDVGLVRIGFECFRRQGGVC